MDPPPFRIDKAYRINMVLDNLPITMYDLESEVGRMKLFLNRFEKQREV